MANAGLITRRWGRIRVAALAFIAATSAACGQVLLRARLAPGDTLRYDFHTSLNIGKPDDSDPDRLEQEGRVRFTVAEVDRDGNATVRMAFETLKAKRHAAGKDSSYEPSDHPAEGGDSPLAKTYAELATSILELGVSPEGEIERIGGMESALKAAVDAGTEDASRLLGPLSPGGLAATLAPVFTLDPSGAARKPGDTWTVVRDLEAIDPYTAKASTAYTLKSVMDGIAEAAGPIVISLHAKTEPDATPVMSVTDQSGSATAKWDAGKGRLVSFTAEQRATWKATLATKDPMAASRRTESKVELKAVE